MAAPIDLSLAKKNLSDVLGDDMTNYLSHLKAWFRQKISKEEFDMEARKFFKSDKVHLHNEFLLAIISKCQSLSASLIPTSPPLLSPRRSTESRHRRRPAAKRSTFQQRFDPVNPVTCAVHATYKGAEEIVFASRELSLPDISMVHGRLLVSAWECGLRDVSDNAVKLVMQSVEQQLKNIISHVISRRNGYKLREKRFKFAMGTDVANPYTRHKHMFHDMSVESEATIISEKGSHIPSTKLPADYGVGYSAEQISRAVAVPQYNRGPITLYNLLEGLQIYKNAIPSHSVYAPAIERIIHKLWHPSHDELETESQEEVRLRKQLSSSHQAFVR